MYPREAFSLKDNLLLLVNGHGGIGKTAIAAKYYHTYHHEYTHVAWVLSEKALPVRCCYLLCRLAYNLMSNKIVNNVLTSYSPL